MGRFFVSCALGAERELLAEMREFWFEMADLDGMPTRSAFPEHEELKGGIEVECPEHLAFQINFFTKMGNRVLQRIAHFESRYFDQFEKNLSRVELGKLLDPGPVQLRIESHKSRLNNEKSIQEAASRALAGAGFAVSDTGEYTIYIRIEKDRVTVSLDTTGEHLHRRGYALYRGEAPLRETLAARVVRRLSSHTELNAELTLIDPFAGSGTLLFEALSFRQPNFQRHYAWLKFRSTPKLFKSPTWSKNYRWVQSEGSKIQAVGLDIDPKAIRNAEKNMTEFSKLFHRPDMVMQQQNSGEFLPERERYRKKIWIIANPPYGVRLDDDRAREILGKLGDLVDGMVVLHPLNWNFEFKRLRKLSAEDFSNQGLNLRLSVFG